MKKIDIYDYMNVIMRELKKGVLLTTKKSRRVNTMTISWGKIGIEWNKLIFCAYVRDSRYTYEQLESGVFTINIPMDNDVKNILSYCGTKSGRTHNKIRDLNLTLVDGQMIDVPAIRELPLTLECKVNYIQEQDKNAISQEICDRFYREDAYATGNHKYHTMFYGEIINAYIVE